MASASSSSTSCTEVACEVQPTTAALPTVASPSNLVAVGRKLDRIHNTRPICWNKTIGNSRRADRWAVNVRCKLPLRRALWSEAMGSVRSEDPKNLNRQQQTARGLASPLRPLKRACGSDITIGGLAPDRPRASHGSKTSPHAYVGEQLLAGGALHSGNTFWKN